MNRVLLPLLALLVLASIALPNTAQAYIITVDFTFSYSPFDPFFGASPPVNGSFSFDSNLIPSTLPGFVTDYSNGLALDSFDLTMAGHTYTNGTDAILGDLHFDAAGKVVGWGLYGLANGASGITSGTNDFLITPLAQPYEVNYTYPGAAIYLVPTLTSWSVTYGTDQAPEPGSLALFAPALLAFGLISRRRR